MEINHEMRSIEMREELGTILRTSTCICTQLSVLLFLDAVNNFPCRGDTSRNPGHVLIDAGNMSEPWHFSKLAAVSQSLLSPFRLPVSPQVKCPKVPYLRSRPSLMPLHIHTILCLLPIKYSALLLPPTPLPPAIPPAATYSPIG